MTLISSKTFAAGALFFTLGVGAVAFGWDLPRGQASRMGPGYFPMLLSFLLTGLGLVTMAKAALASGERLDHWHWQRMVFILGSIAVFALLITKTGLAIAAFAIVTISASAASDKRWREILVLAVCLSAASVILFVVLLGLPLRVWP